MPVPADATETIRIAAQMDDESQLLAHIFARGFERFGRDAEIIPGGNHNDPFGPLGTREANFTFTCTGLRLEQTVPEKAAEFEQRAAADPEIESKLEDQPKTGSAEALETDNAAQQNGDAGQAGGSGNEAPAPVVGGIEFYEEVYGAFLGTIPGEFAGGPRGMAQGCEKPADKNIPYDIVALYAKPAVSQYLERYLLGPIAGWLSQEELDNMLKEMEEGADPSVLAALFLDEFQIHP
ncbi:hypothetical protein [Corynebacterium ulceribovis]|uniref:hypothetical protein n=1 Tax=Corynebacterium ulceribovis TaxID=487732 RepID=UPI0003705030|nr:hypothetical protein [Corynebacterium ulceribovis]